MKILKRAALITLSLLLLLSLGWNLSTLRQNRGKASSLTDKRVRVIQEYLKLLGAGKYKEIVPFFTPDAILSDPIKGLTTPEIYYNGLYDYLINPMVTVYDTYLGLKDKDVLAAHFTMKVHTKEGTIGNRGQIVDLFVFSPNSTQFAKLYIQNNMTDYEFTD